MKKILILGNSNLVVYKFRKELVEELVCQKYDVYVSFPNGPFGEGEENSKKFGCKFIETPINRRGMNPIDDIKLLLKYIKMIKKINPDVVLGYTVKPDIYGGLACRFLKIPFIANITGLGSGLAKEGLTRKIMIKLYKCALKNSKCVFFQNESDKKFFEDNKIALGRGKLLPGSGVNINEFLPLPYPKDKEIHFAYIARVMKAKGIDEYLEAARVLKSKYRNVIFNVAGYCEEDYKEILDKAAKDKIIVYHGLVEDMIAFQRNNHCTVLPTYHPEGISNVLLEAAACARPIITTNRSGCRETVIDGETGYLIKEKNKEDLIEKMERIIKLSNEDREKMGLLGREKIEKEFDRTIVVNEYMKIVNS